MELNEYYKRVSGRKILFTKKNNPVAEAEYESYEKSLALAMEVRKFEIELYWKRAQYFWAFIASIYAAYFAVYTSDKIAAKPLVTLILSLLAFSFSFGWYLNNKGSKFWQQNWEIHVDLLEEKVGRNLYKTVLRTKKGCNIKRYIVGAEPFSVSNINCLLSFIMFCVSALLLITEIIEICFENSCGFTRFFCTFIASIISMCLIHIAPCIMLFSVVSVVIALCCFFFKYSRSNIKLNQIYNKDDNDIEFYFRKPGE